MASLGEPILLAEDNLVNQKVALKLLQNLGYSADVVANGQEVLQLLKDVPYDLILMDCQMPILDGLEATREINRWEHKSFANLCPPIIIAITANAMKQDMQKCLDAGMNDYLSKPVLKEELAAALEYWSQFIFMRYETITTENHAPIDWERLHQISGNDRDFESFLLQVLIEDAQSFLEIIKVAIATNDFPKIIYVTHQLKGASGNVGAKSMQSISENIEQLASKQDCRGMALLIAQLEGYLQNIQTYIGSLATQE